MSRNACRCTAISLAIVLLLTAAPTNGFTIHRNQEESETETLVAAESTLLEVKNELNRPNDIKAFQGSKTEGLEKQTTDSYKNKYTYDTIKSKQKLDKGASPHDETFKTTPDLTTDFSKGSVQFTTIELKTAPTAATTIDTGKYVGTTINTEDTATSPEREFTETYSPYTSTQLASTNAINNTKSPEKKLPTASAKYDYNFEITTVISLINLAAEVNTLQETTSLDEPSSTVVYKDESGQTVLDKKKKELQSSPEVTSTIIETATNTPIDGSRTFDGGSTTSFATEEFTKTTNELSTVQNDASGMIDLMPIRSVTNGSSELSTISDISTNIRDSQETKSDVTTEPSWRKYTVIDRKHSSTELSSNTDKNAKEGLSTRKSLEEALAVTPIASLERLREDLIAIKNKLEAIHELTTAGRAITGTETMSPNPVPKKADGKVGMVSSMRAGFLDYSGKSSQEKTTTEKQKETFGKLYDSEAGEIDRLTHKYGSDVESQSQLAEDAIKEELMKEAMLNDNVANAHRYRDDRAQIPRIETSLTPDVRTALDSQSNQTENKTTNDDALSVQPISQEQGKNLELYAVNPNYKPMKRIEVQPAKAFVRDPDDNSWRNESISSLGIVFKPKNSSISFTQVLKNKTENVLNSLAERDSKNGVPDLRERLEKIAEVRKSKKKRINKFGDTVYSDYEESSASGEGSTTPRTETTTASSTAPLSSSIPTSTPSSTTELITTPIIETTKMTVKIQDIFETIPTPIDYILKEKDTLTTRKPSKFYNIAEYYDATDEYDADYLSMSKIDLKKFTEPVKAKVTDITPPIEVVQTKPIAHYPPDRKPTIQYFPPRVSPKVNVHDYDEDFNRKVNQYTIKNAPKIPEITTFRTVTSTPIQNEQQGVKEISIKPTPIPQINPIDINQKLSTPSVPHVPGPLQGFVANNGDFNRASYVIKHYGDFINEAAKDDDDRNSDYVVLTESPIRGITVDELAKLTTGKPTTIDNDYDYETQYRKDILNRFVDNFNQNSERFKVDFPVLYNNSIVHRNMHDNGRGLASSSAFMKRLYNDAVGTKSNFLLLKKPCDPNCDKLAVELSPAYELHYYVPDQEEKEEVDPRAATAHYRYRL